jgi:hypothetical protein
MDMDMGGGMGMGKGALCVMCDVCVMYVLRVMCNV